MLATHPEIELVKGIIYEVDNCRVNFQDNTVTNQFGKNVSILNLSTGCKTLLNILTHPNSIFFGQEMGINAFNILLLMDGAIYLDWLPLTYDKYEDMLYNFHPTPTSSELLSYEEGWNKYVKY